MQTYGETLVKLLKEEIRFGTVKGKGAVSYCQYMMTTHQEFVERQTW